VGEYRAAVGFRLGGHAIQRLRVWGSSDIIGHVLLAILFLDNGTGRAAKLGTKLGT